MGRQPRQENCKIVDSLVKQDFVKTNERIHLPLNFQFEKDFIVVVLFFFWHKRKFRVRTILFCPLFQFPCQGMKCCIPMDFHLSWPYHFYGYFRKITGGTSWGLGVLEISELFLTVLSSQCCFFTLQGLQVHTHTSQLQQMETDQTGKWYLCMCVCACSYFHIWNSNHSIVNIYKWACM